MKEAQTIVGFVVVAGVIAVGLSLINRTIDKAATNLNSSIQALPANLVGQVGGIFTAR